MFQHFLSNFLSQRTEKLRWGTLLGFKKFVISKDFMDKRGVGRKGVSRLLVKYFLNYSAEKVHRVTLYSVFRILVSNIDKFVSARGLCHVFLSKFFCLAVLKNFVGEPFCVSQIFVYRKMLAMKEGADITVFREICYASQYRITS